MTLPQKQIIRELIEQSIGHGFGCFLPLTPIAEKFGITELLYDNNTETGVLWDVAQKGEGWIEVQNWNGLCAAVSYEEHAMLRNWCREDVEPIG